MTHRPCLDALTEAMALPIVAGVRRDPDQENGDEACAPSAGAAAVATSPARGGGTTTGAGRAAPTSRRRRVGRESALGSRRPVRTAPINGENTSSVGHQVVNRPLEEGGVITGTPEPAVAPVAQEGSEAARPVAMIDGQDPDDD